MRIAFFIAGLLFLATEDTENTEFIYYCSLCSLCPLWLIPVAKIYLYSKPPGRVALLPSGLVTVTSFFPFELLGVVQVIFVELTTTTFVAGTPPMVTFAPGSKA